MRSRAKVRVVQNRKRIHELAKQCGIPTTKVLTTRARAEEDADAVFTRLEVERPLAELIEELRSKGMI